MTPDDWTDALDTERHHADPRWARNAHHTVLWRRATRDLTTLLGGRTFAELVVISALPATGFLLIQVPMPSHIFQWAHPAAEVLWTSGIGLLLTVVWLTRHILRGAAPWALAFLAASVSTLPTLLLVSSGLREASDVFTLSTVTALLPLIVRLCTGALFTFGLLLTFGWGLSTLVRPHRSVTP